MIENIVEAAEVQTQAAQLPRRDFLKFSVAATGGLLASALIPVHAQGVFGLLDAASGSTPASKLGAWLRITNSGDIVFAMSQAEMGQGAHTGLSMVVAEELDAPFGRVKLEQAPVTAAYANPRYVGANGGQGTGGSSSISQVAPPIRIACATIRAALLQAAASRFGVPVSECETDQGFVLHRGSNRRLGYGEVAEAAAALPVPQGVAPKNPKDFKLLGKNIPRVDMPAKLNGRAKFGIDMDLPGMQTALVAKSRVFGAKMVSFDASASLKVKGVKAVVPISAGVAVVADSFWHAKKGRDVLKVVWEERPDSQWDSANLSQTMKALAELPGITGVNRGDVVAAFTGAAKTIEAEYQSPYLDTAPLEPMNATAWVKPDQCEIWAPMQFQSRALSAAVRITGMTEEKIVVNTTYLGGGFGRRFYHDFIEEAVETSKALGLPVKVLRTREDDMQHSFYRPASYNKLSVALDASGKISGWRHKAVSSSILRTLWPERVNAQTGLDGTATQGAANLLYDLPNYRVDWVRANSPVPVGIWRSVGDSQNAFVTQSMMDEVALAAGADPLQFRRDHLNATPQARRLKAVLEMVAEKAGWGQKPQAGVFRGIAAVQCYGAYAAQVAEVTITPEGKIKVLKIVAGLDCGWVTSPDLVLQQAQGGVMYGLSAAMGEAITIKNGAVEQANFGDYTVMRGPDMPSVEFHLMPSTEAPLSVGEPAGTPCVAPAVANAVFAATGVRMRNMPFSQYTFKRA
jgi:isoquinoline 1-oxidoreductase subunit beta